MKINIIYPKTKINTNYLESYKEYIKRLTPYCKISLSTYKKNKEIETYITNKNTYIISKIDTTISTENFSNIIAKHKIIGNLNFIFCDQALENSLDNIYKKICLSKIEIGEIEITLLLEQIYRSYTIFEGKTYHK